MVNKFMVLTQSSIERQYEEDDTSIRILLGTFQAIFSDENIK